MPDLHPGAQVDRYVVEKLLGRGGMASVWRVRRDDLGVRYALKLLEVPGRTVAERLLDEGRIQATLRHPNVVSVVDVLTFGERPALVLEYVDGPTLEALLQAHRLGPEQIDDVARGILRGVRAAHKAGFVHRDLKPANVLMARSDDGFVPKIADFGLAKLVRGDAPAATSTRTGLLMGTPAYMAPEQLRNARDVDARADVYSLGVMLYEICTGRRPYEADDLVELVDAVRSRRYPSVAELAPELPARMGEAVARAMEPDLDRRFQDVQAVYDAWTGRAERGDGPWTRDLLTSFDEGAEQEAPRPPPAVAASVLEAREHRARAATAPPPPRGLRALVALLGAAGTAALVASGVGLVAVVALLAWAFLAAEATPDAGSDPLAPPVAASPAPPAPEPQVTPEPEAPAAPAPAPVRAAPSAPSAPEPAPVAEEPPPTVASGVGHVKVKGEATVELRDASGGRFKPGRKLPAGTWTYTARFPDGEAVAGTFVLEPGTTRTLSCDDTFGAACKVE